MGKYKIAVYAICKNEEKFIDRWVDSMNEADIIVVADTGSTDNTVEKLKSRGVDVHVIEVKPWRFDKARNLALDFIPQDVDICVSTDLDEIFEKGWREKLENAWAPGTTRLFYSFVGSYHPDGRPDKVFLKEKIHDRHLYRWSRPVHEILEYIGEGSEVNNSDPSILLNHYPDIGKSRGQYLPLLELTVEEFPQDDRSMHYLGREYMFAGMYDKAIETLQRHLNMPNAGWIEERCASMRFISRSYLFKGDKDKAKEWLFKAIEQAPHTREPYLDLARLYQGEENWEGLRTMVKAALSITHQANSYLVEPSCWDYTLYDLGGLSCFYLGFFEESLEYAARALEIAPYDGRLKSNYEVVKAKVESLK